MYKAYRKEFEYSYVMGIYPVIELIDQRPDLIRTVFISSEYDEKERLMARLEYEKIPYKIDDKAINRISKKSNNYLIAVFDKESQSLGKGNHIVLDRPSNMGNLGTIIRTMVGFGYKDLAITGHGCDHFHPRVVRSSMGSFFKIRIEKFQSIEEYASKFKDNDLYLFMLGGDSLMDVKEVARHSLCFGNEGEGLADEEKSFGKAVKIPQSDEIDSLNLPISASIAMFYFKNII